jgi:hypothetical protein
MKEDFTKVSIIETSEEMAPFQQDLIKDKIGSMSGIEILQLTPQFLKVKYYPYLHDETELITALKQIGLKRKQKPNFFRRLINKIIKENKKSFGNQKLDCCDLNKD